MRRMIVNSMATIMMAHLGDPTQIAMGIILDVVQDAEISLKRDTSKRQAMVAQNPWVVMALIREGPAVVIAEEVIQQ